MENFFYTSLNYFYQVILSTAYQLLILFGPLLLSAVIMHFVAASNEKLTCRITGTQGYLVLFGWLGTPVHELGHALFALLFGHKITAIKLFSPNPTAGTLGYISHTWNKKNLYQVMGNFFNCLSALVK